MNDKIKKLDAYRGEVAINERIKNLRNAMKITQQKMSQEIGVSWVTINRWENAKTVPSPLAMNIILSLEEKFWPFADK